jgi:hypothetical protein
MKPWQPELNAVELSAWKRRTGSFALLLLLATLWAERLTANSLALYFIQRQDFPVLVLASVSCLVVAIWSPRWSLPKGPIPLWALLLVGCGISALLAWGTHVLMGNLPLSRDEHMVVFDMAVYRSGRLVMPIPGEWRPYALSLVPEFLLNTNHPTGFISSYLPVNPMLRLAFSLVADPAWYNPLLVVLGGAALLDIAKRTFGQEDRACIVVLLVYALSAQVLVNSMTNYSMTGHLALNLVWLAAFLRGGKFWNSVAILTGFVAVGLHQFAFHPFFVAPFLFWKLRDGELKRVYLYLISYAVIVLFWALYPHFVSSLVATSVAHASKGNFITDQVIPNVMRQDPRTIPLMILNVLRFVAWQNLMLVPLVIAAVPVAVRERGLARALLVGIIAWLIFVMLTLPSQGRGWGYRYLNGYIGSFALLAGFGYRELERRLGRRADGMVVSLSGLTLAASLPLLLIATHEFMEPRLKAEWLVASQKTPFVLIDNELSPSTDGNFRGTTDDLVRNLPDLSNRPLRFASDRLDRGLLVLLCKRGAVTLITHHDMHTVGKMMNVADRSPKFERLVASAEQGAPGCFRPATALGFR